MCPLSGVLGCTESCRIVQKSAKACKERAKNDRKSGVFGPHFWKHSQVGARLSSPIWQRPGGSRPRAVGGRQKAEGRKQKAVGGKQKHKAEGSSAAGVTGMNRV